MCSSDLMQAYVLRNGDLELWITHVSLVHRSQMPRMWRGLGAILSVDHPGNRLGKPTVITTSHGLRAITGLVVGSRLTGTATIFPGPSREFGIEIVVLAPRHTSAARRAAALRVVTSLMFTAQDR